MSADVPVRVAIVGAGAIGGVLAYRLAAAGERVGVVARGAHLQAIRQRGLALYDKCADRTLPALRMLASDEPADLGAQDIVFLALKAHALPEMLPRLGPMLGPDTVVVPAINGIPWWYFHGVEGAYANWRLGSIDPHGTMFDDLDARRVLGCVVHFAAELFGPGVVQHTSDWRLVFGEPDRSKSARLDRVASTMRAAGFEVEIAADIRLAVWWKLLGNMSFNPIAALHRKLVHEICEDESLRATLRPMMTEGIAVAEKLGVRITGTPDDRIQVASRLRGAKVSMLQDLEAGRKLELGAILKAPIEIADRVGVPVPTLRRVDDDVTRLAVAQGLYP